MSDDAAAREGGSASEPSGEPAAPSDSGEVFVDVAVTLPLPMTFTYRDPRRIKPPLGTQVVVPFGARMVTGFVVGFADHSTGPVRDIEEVIGDEPALDEDILELCRWAASYYIAPLGEVLRGALPQGERAEAARRIAIR